jgi:hypothetical protein
MTSFNVGFVLFPNLTQLDLTGPCRVLSGLPDAQVHIPAKTLDPAPSDCGLSLVPHHDVSKLRPAGPFVPSRWRVRSGSRHCRQRHRRARARDMSPQSAREPSSLEPPDYFRGVGQRPTGPTRTCFPWLARHLGMRASSKTAT